MYLIYKDENDNEVKRFDLNEGTDEHRIEKGFNKIDEIISNVASIEPYVESALKGLKNKRKLMK